MVTGPNTARWLTGEALAALGRLRKAWPWLSQVRVPGRYVPVLRPPDERESTRARAREQWAKDRHAAYEAIKAGRKPTGPHADAARIGPIAARARIAVDVAAAAGRLLEHRGVSTRSVVLQPAGYGMSTECRACSGTGQTPPPRWWPAGKDWPARPASWPPDLHGPVHLPPCRHCRGGRVAVAVVFDQADAVVVTGLEIVAALLPEVTDELVAAEVLRTLDRAALLAHRVCGVDEDRRWLDAVCPACTRRNLHVEVGSINRAEWSITCAHPLCRCKGPGCKCGRPRSVAVEGRRHLWPAAEWDGPTGLARRLGVDLPGTQRYEPDETADEVTE